MSADQWRALEALRDHGDVTDDNAQVDDDDSYGAWDVLDGTQPLDISHGGGELQELTRGIAGDFWNAQSVRRKDYRSRRDRTQRRIEAFDYQMPALVTAYLTWSLERDEKRGMGFFERQKDVDADDVNAGQVFIEVVDIHHAEKVHLSILSSDMYLASALVRHGVIPCSPINPSVGMTIDCLEFYRIARQRCPNFSIQAFTKTLCDLQGKRFRSYLSRQLSIALDLYLLICTQVRSLVQEAIGRSAIDWNLKHACPACLYTLDAEPQLKFSLLYAMDGNDSLKRVLKRVPDEEHAEDLVSRNNPQSSELPTSQAIVDYRYLTREYVDSFADALNPQVDLFDDDEDDNPCAGRWKNMKDDKTKRMWGVFDESGIFMAVCRHGFTLIIADMVQSGERAKYPLAVVSRLLDTFGHNLGGGYDIGCRFKTTLSRSSLGPRARTLNHTSLVGAFHGHAHRRLCQLDHLTTYVTGLGLEDLEGCERTFSKSNALAPATRYASVFHRRQAILGYFEHNDEFEIYHNLTTFLYNNYKQALDILYDGQTVLPRLMQELGVTDESELEAWLENERAYLLSRTHEPEQETLQMEYWQKLVNLSASKKELDGTAWSLTTPGSSFGQADVSMTVRLETARRHALENYEKDLKIVHDLEMKLGVDKRWQPEDIEWQNAGRLVANRKYQLALDTLEGLIVARIFELSKMNRAGTGYKMRKHIGKALQVRSAAIRTALDRYNLTAHALSSPRPALKWEDVVEYAFLADFELLRDAREDISQRPWATPSGRHAMDLYFKMCRAREEIERLNVEIRRVATYLQDERHYLEECEILLHTLHPGLAHQVQILRNTRGRFLDYHCQRLRDIAGLPGFSGTLLPGQALHTGPGESASSPSVQVPHKLCPAAVDESLALGTLSGDEDGLEDLEEEEDDEQLAEEESRTLQDILEVSGHD
ncbi:uncharacterized protein HD556DRAFT_1479424 [Suillus plorans]|uniref:CxC1-like cysteine cluster associated with KDZ transposases domain-containing protein n=1 Tax=Suillus plorans TaxID=116603 RepID=A0A9P7AP09_9AGAM|nr:uncharacterized protein HD556DRAFT_1479424 [Suillus plorans]KAG1793324.1 hypothetical protein HD556DRAFT_1479424 [Suillus plorans]